MNSTSEVLMSEGMGFSWAYRQHSHPSYWGDVTSKHNFCEQDFIITQYIAEFINTLTNLTYCYYAYHGIKNNKNRTDAFLRNLPYLGIASVGIGSAIYHSTLKNYTQWCDDLSMLLATFAVFHRVSTFNQTLQTTVLYGIFLSLFITFFTIWHISYNDIIGHSILFAIMVTLVSIKTRQIINKRVVEPSVKREVGKLINWGSVIFVSGFALWIVDNECCGLLTTWKRGIGMPWSFILELHGWWHILTGIGAYIFIALVEYLTSEEAGQPLGNSFAWPVGILINPLAGKHVEIGGNVSEEGGKKDL